MNLNLDVTTRDKNDLLFIGSPRQWRADCQAGQFKIGASLMRGHRLKMQVIAAKIIEDELFGYPFQQWLNVVFADPDGVVSGIMFKTESMDNFLELYRQSLAAEKPLTGVMIEAVMSKRASRQMGESYYAVEFQMVGDGLYSEAIARFRQSLPSNLYRIPDSIDAPPEAEYQPEAV